MKKYYCFIVFHLVFFSSCKYFHEKQSQTSLVNTVSINDLEKPKVKQDWNTIKSEAEKGNLRFKDFVSIIPTKNTPISYIDYLHLLVSKDLDNDTLSTYLVDTLGNSDLMIIYTSEYSFSSIEEALKLREGSVIKNLCYDGDFSTDFTIPTSYPNLNKVMPKSEEGIAFIAPIFKLVYNNVITIAYLTVNWSYSPYAAITLKSYNEDGNLLSLENNYMSLFSAMLFEGEYIRRQIVIQNPNKLEMEEINYVFPSLYENEGMEDKENINQYNVSKSKFVLKPEGWILDK